MAKYLHSKSKKLQQKRRKALLLRVYFFGFLAILLIVLFVWLMQKPFIRVNDVAIRGLDTLNAEEIINLSKQELQGKYVYLVPRDNLLFYPRTKLERSLYDFDARIKKVEVDASSKGLLTVTLEEHKPEYLYCNEICFYADSNGYIFRDAQKITRTLYINLEDETRQLEKRDYYNPEYFDGIKSMIDLLSQKDIEISRVVKVGEHDFDLYSASGLLIKVDFDESNNKLQQYLNVFIEANKTQIENKKIEYIDARFGKKIFFKLTEGENKSQDIEE